MLVAAVTRVAFGQGGPPMITDDPGTPGNGKWENNMAIAFDNRPNETLIELPAIDLNYGLGDHVQLTLQTAPILLKRSCHGLIGGIGGTEAAVKWRFLFCATRRELACIWSALKNTPRNILKSYANSRA